MSALYISLSAFPNCCAVTLTLLTTDNNIFVLFIDLTFDRFANIVDHTQTVVPQSTNQQETNRHRNESMYTL